jgi:hypothetical protein
MNLFKGKARGILCHNGRNSTDNKFYNVGVPQVGPLKEDLGRFMVTRAEKDKGAFKTPTLRRNGSLYEQRCIQDLVRGHRLFRSGGAVARTSVR